MAKSAIVLIRTGKSRDELHRAFEMTSARGKSRSHQELQSLRFLPALEATALCAGLHRKRHTDPADPAVVMLEGRQYSVMAGPRRLFDALAARIEPGGDVRDLFLRWEQDADAVIIL